MHYSTVMKIQIISKKSLPIRLDQSDISKNGKILHLGQTSDNSEMDPFDENGHAALVSVSEYEIMHADGGSELRSKADFESC